MSTLASGETAFHLMVVENDFPSVQWLLERGTDINTRNMFGNTPLMEAAGLGYREMCEFLLAHGADIEARSESEETALSEAAKREEPDMLRILLKHLPPEADINTYFNKLDADMILDKGGSVFRRGLPNCEVLACVR